MNRKYEKPTIVASRVSSEGVYLASGNADIEISQKSRWDKNAIYDVIFKSLPAQSGAHQQEAHAYLYVTGANVESVQSYANCTSTFSGNTIDVHLIAWNNQAQILITCDADDFTVSK